MTIHTIKCIQKIKYIYLIECIHRIKHIYTIKCIHRKNSVNLQILACLQRRLSSTTFTNTFMMMYLLYFMCKMSICNSIFSYSFSISMLKNTIWKSRTPFQEGYVFHTSKKTHLQMI